MLISILIQFFQGMNEQRRHGSSSSQGSIFNGGDLRLERLLCDLTLLRISFNELIVTAQSESLRSLEAKGSLYSLTLSYSFPVPKGVSSSLLTRVTLRSHAFSSTSIHFKHKRVNLIKLRPDVIPFWSRACLVLELEAQLSVRGRFSVRPLARCSIPLDDLLLAPFCISREFQFLGQHLEGVLQVKIDLGSQQRVLMERLNKLRQGSTDSLPASRPRLESGAAGPADETFSVPAEQALGTGRHKRSRSSSRCQSRGSGEDLEQENQDNDVFHLDESTREDTQPRRRRFGLASNGNSTQLGQHRAPAFSALSAGNNQVCASAGCKRIRLIVHSLSGLPMTRDNAGFPVPPRVFISVRGRDGELRSPVHAPSRSPHFEWTCSFLVSGERRNLVVKVLHEDEEGNDKALGFVSLPLPMQKVKRCNFDVVDLSSANHDSAVITLSAEMMCPELPQRMESLSLLPSAPCTRPSSALPPRPRSSSPSRLSYRTHSENDHSSHRPPPPSAPLRIRTPSPTGLIILESREEIENRLRRNMNELDRLINDITHRDS